MNWVSNPLLLALSSWQKGLEMALCWFVSILMMALLKVESRSLVVTMVLLQKAASNNDPPSLSLPSGGPLHKITMTRVMVVTITSRNVEIVYIESIILSDISL